MLLSVGNEMKMYKNYMFGMTPSEVKRIKREAVSGLKSKPIRQDNKDYNFGVSKNDLKRYRRQVLS